MRRLGLKKNGIHDDYRNLFMFVATLMTGHEATRLDPTLVETVRDEWRGGAVLWLASGVAAEFSTPRMPCDYLCVRSKLQELGVDLVVQRAEGRRKRMLLADMDSTMIRQECIDELAAEAGVGAHVAAVTIRAMNGELDFGEALRERVGLLKGLPVDIVRRVYENRIVLTPGGRELVATMKAHGAHTALISGGFTAFSARVSEALGFDEHRANVLNVRAGKLTGTVAEPILGRDAKTAALREISERLGLDPVEAMAVGDGANDLGMLALAGTGVAFHARPTVAEKSDIRVDHGDLTALLYVQGYRRDEFVN